jgi:multicomponent Na+:H+ antiporter subunit F
MSDVFLGAAVAEAAIVFLLLGRLALGPSAADRFVAANAIATQATLAAVCFAAATRRAIYLDPAIWLASFSYLAALVWARLAERELL